MLYSHKNKYPAELPFRIRLSDGSTRTDPTTFTKEELSSAGFVEVDDKPLVEYPQYVSWSGTAWVICSYTLEDQKSVKLGALSEMLREVSLRPAVDTGLGFSVDAGYQDLQSFTVGLELGVTSVRSTDNQSYVVTLEQLEQIVNTIKNNGLHLLQTKWALEDAIKQASTQQELDAVIFG